MIFRKKVFGQENKKVVFILTGWGTKIWQFAFVAGILKKHGFQSIIYEYDKKILSSDANKTAQYLVEVKQDVINTIKILKKEGINNFNLFGTSLGTILSSMVSNESQDIKKLILNLTGADLAEVVWSWDKMSGSEIKKGLIEKKIDLKKLRQLWRNLAPINNLSKKNKQKLLIYLSEADERIPYKLGIKLINDLKQNDVKFDLIINKHSNHLFSGLFNLFNHKKYIDFLTK